MFTENPEIEAKRSDLAYQYDVVFARIQATEKQSEEHLELLEMEHILNNRTISFLKQNARYFREKKNYLVMKGVMNRPQLIKMDEEERKYFSPN